MLRTFLVAALAVAASAAMAQEDPVAARKALMKEAGAASRAAGQMAREQAPFDLAKAQEVLATFAKVAERSPALFPHGSGAGDTAASPKVWESEADFRKRFEDWADVIRQASANTKDLASFSAEFPKVAQGCGSCHDAYRLKK